MQHIELVRLLVSVDSSGHWVDDRLDEAVAKAREEHRHVEPDVALGEDEGEYSPDLKQQGEVEKIAHAECVEHWRGDQDRACKPEEGHRRNEAVLLMSQVKCGFDLGGNIAADDEDHGRDDQSKTTGYKEPLLIHLLFPPMLVMDWPVVETGREIIANLGEQFGVRR